MRRTLYFLLMSVCILVGLSGCTGPGEGLITPPTSTPTGVSTATASPTITPTAAATTTSNTAGLTQVITRYYDAVKAQNYAQAYTYLDPSAKDANGQTITLSSFEQMAQTMESEGGPVVSFSIGVYPPMIVMDVMRSLLVYHAHLQVKQEGQTWKITSLDRV